MKLQLVCMDYPYNFNNIQHKFDEKDYLMVNVIK